MKSGLIILIFYVVPLVVDLVHEICMNWSEIKTLGDLLLPRIDGSRDLTDLIYLPIVNIFFMIFIIMGWIFDGIACGIARLAEKSGLVRLVTKIMNIRIKK